MTTNDQSSYTYIKSVLSASYRHESVLLMRH